MSSGIRVGGKFEDGAEIKLVEVCCGVLAALIEELVVLEDADPQVMIEARFEASR